MRADFRCFVALKLPEVWGGTLSRLLRDLKVVDREKDVRWVGFDRLHVTLAFLGQVSSDCIPELVSQLRLACLTSQPLSLGLRGFGTFPETGAPRVLWLGLAGDLGQLATLSSGVVARSSRLVEHFDGKPFRPHLTIGRVRSRLRRKALEQLTHRGKSISIPPVLFPEVKLLRSELHSTGSIYTELQTFPLGAARQAIQ